MVVRFESLDQALGSDAAHALAATQEAVHAAFGTNSTLHLYHAATSGSRALLPHTDPYDVIVVQLQGSKSWTTCTAAVAGASDMSTAHRAQLLEMQLQQHEGCTSYTDENLRGMECSTFTLNEGDTLYLPKGIIHYAIAQDGGSSHITISLERKGLAWADALLAAAAMATTTTAPATLVNGVLPPASAEAFMRGWKAALSQLLVKERGVFLMDTVPTWVGVHSNANSNHDSRAADADPNRCRLWSQRSSRADFLRSFSSLCLEVQPLALWEALAAQHKPSVALGFDNVSTLVQRVCSAETGAAVLRVLCTHGRFPTSIMHSVSSLSKASQVCMCVFVYVCMHVCVDVCSCLILPPHCLTLSDPCSSLVCMCVCVCVCVCVSKAGRPSLDLLITCSFWLDFIMFLLSWHTQAHIRKSL